MIVLKITPRRIKEDGDQHGASYTTIQQVSIIQIDALHKMNEILEEHQRQAKGEAQFLLVQGEMLDVPLVEKREDWVLCIPAATESGWYGRTLQNKTKKEMTEFMDSLYSEWSVCEGGHPNGCEECRYYKEPVEYFQPILSDDEWGEKLQTFEVYSSVAKLLEDFPHHVGRINTFQEDDIENPVIVK